MVATVVGISSKKSCRSIPGGWSTLNNTTCLYIYVLSHFKQQTVDCDLNYYLKKQIKLSQRGIRNQIRVCLKSDACLFTTHIRKHYHHFFVKKSLLNGHPKPFILFSWFVVFFSAISDHRHRQTRWLNWN